MGTWVQKDLLTQTAEYRVREMEEMERKVNNYKPTQGCQELVTGKGQIVF